MKFTTVSGNVGGKVRIPGSKSHTIRALLIAALADGKSYIYNPLYSKDTEACMNACRLLGANLLMDTEKITVTGTSGKLAAPENVIDVGNSGTTLYLAAPIAASIKDYTVFTGDHQIRSRPISPLLQSISDLGGWAVSTRGNDSAPIVIRGKLKGGSTEIECPTSQYLSGLLLAAPLAENDVTINVSLLHERPYVDITLDWLKKAGIKFSKTDYSKFKIPGQQTFSTFSESIPADFSSATFFMCAAAITGGSITLQGLDMNDAQGDKEVLFMLEKMGCIVTTTDEGITINGAELHGAVLDLNATPDALPALAVTACYAKGKTILGNVPQARLKETDRIRVMREELEKLGADIVEMDDGLEINYSPLGGGSVSGHEDHRIIMSMAIAGLKSSEAIEIDNIDAAAITFPEFFTLLDSVRV